MNVLMTGATGFVGKQLTIRLLGQGHSVYAVIRNNKKAEDLRSTLPIELQNRLFVVEGDITTEKLGVSPEELYSLKNKIDIFYHIAAYLSFDPGEREKSFTINLEGTRNALEFAKDIKVTNFFHVSTAYTLGEKRSATETLHNKNNNFVNPYEESKCHAEHLVFKYKDTFNVNIFRPSIIIGDSVTGEADTTFGLYSVIKSFQLLKKRMVRNKETENSTFKFLCNKNIPQNLVPVDYVVNVLIVALTHAKENTIYHITNSNPPTNQLIFKLINQCLKINNVMLVPTTYSGKLTTEERKFNHPIRVFYSYWERSISFDDTNTRELLQRGNLESFNMNESTLKNIISTKIVG